MLHYLTLGMHSAVEAGDGYQGSACKCAAGGAGLKRTGGSEGQPWVSRLASCTEAFADCGVIPRLWQG